MTDKLSLSKWLPTTVKEMQQLGWEKPDVVFFSGDAYIDHPSFGTAMIARVMEHAGMKVVIVPQPNWQDDLRDFKKFGNPNYFFAVTSGCMDSMVNHYTAFKRLRSDDAYSPEGKAGFRPDYATETYSLILKKLFPDVPVILGGIEATQRRFTHYDYWQDKLLPSILISSKADYMIYGMGETSIFNICKHLLSGGSFNDIKNMAQVVYSRHKTEETAYCGKENTIFLKSHENCLKSKKMYAQNFVIIETESNKMYPSQIVQQIGNVEVVANPPNKQILTDELDSLYELPFTRLPHPKYSKRGAIPAYEMIKHSITIHRGCFGGCAFCAISMTQGKFICSRSEKSILTEVRKIANMSDFKGYISDLGGPSANMFQMQGMDLKVCAKCQKNSCIYPVKCKNLKNNHKELINLYQKAEKIDSVKKIFISSGIRYDLLFEGDNLSSDGLEYMRQVMKNHVSGRLKVAPEHTQTDVLKLMRKPSYSMFQKFYKAFNSENTKAGLKLQLIPYFISSHPGCGLHDMLNLYKTTKTQFRQLEQIQDFTPTPMTLSTVMFYTGLNPYTGEKIEVTHDMNEKRTQRNFFFINNPEILEEVKKYLRAVKRFDILKQLF